MCDACYDHYGRPEIDNDNVRRLVQAIDNLYLDHGAGGSLHIVVDDWNLEDDSVEWCRNWAEEQGGFDPEEQACYDALVACTVDERASAMAFDRSYPVPFPTGEIVTPNKIVDNGDGTYTLTFEFGEDDEDQSYWPIRS